MTSFFSKNQPLSEPLGFLDDQDLEYEFLRRQLRKKNCFHSVQHLDNPLSGLVSELIFKEEMKKKHQDEALFYESKLLRAREAKDMTYPPKYKRQVISEKTLKAEKPTQTESFKSEKSIKTERVKNEKPIKIERIKNEKSIKTERIKNEKPIKTERIKNEKPIKTERIQSEKSKNVQRFGKNTQHEKENNYFVQVDSNPIQQSRRTALKGQVKSKREELPLKRAKMEQSPTDNRGILYPKQTAVQPCLSPETARFHSKKTHKPQRSSETGFKPAASQKPSSRRKPLITSSLDPWIPPSHHSPNHDSQSSTTSSPGTYHSTHSDTLSFRGHSSPFPTSASEYPLDDSRTEARPSLDDSFCCFPVRPLTAPPNFTFVPIPEPKPNRQTSKQLISQTLLMYHQKLNNDNGSHTSESVEKGRQAIQAFSQLSDTHKRSEQQVASQKRPTPAASSNFPRQKSNVLPRNQSVIQAYPRGESQITQAIPQQKTGKEREVGRERRETRSTSLYSHKAVATECNAAPQNPKTALVARAEDVHIKATPAQQPQGTQEPDKSLNGTNIDPALAQKRYFNWTKNREEKQKRNPEGNAWTGKRYFKRTWEN